VEIISPAVRSKSALPGNALVVDVVFYLTCLAFAAASALASEFYGYRVWGNCAIAGYGLAAAHTCWLLARTKAGRTDGSWLGSRWIGIALVATFAMLAPLAVLVVRRLTGVDWLITPISWSAQPEVWVIERSAGLLLAHGTPYVDVTALDRAPVVNDYTPYGPVMTVFGLPRALFGGSPVANALTDARLVFALVACLCVLATLRLLRWPGIPIRAAHLALAIPLTTLTWAVAGPDLAIVSLLVLGCALAVRGRPMLSAIVLAMAVSAKLIVAPAVVVLAVMVLNRAGSAHEKRLTVGKFLATLVAVSVVLNFPVLLVDPRAFIEHVIRFPLGLGMVTSPAASPLPGHLIASIGSAGKTIAYVLLGLTALAIAIWIVRRPPVTGSDALLRIAVGLGALILLTPATRYGYLVYPLVLLGAMLVFRRSEQASVCTTGRAAPPAPAATSS
jgi:hypothetical protein